MKIGKKPFYFVRSVGNSHTHTQKRAHMRISRSTSSKLFEVGARYSGRRGQKGPDGIPGTMPRKYVIEKDFILFCKVREPKTAHRQKRAHRRISRSTSSELF